MLALRFSASERQQHVISPLQTSKTLRRGGPFRVKQNRINENHHDITNSLARSPLSTNAKGNNVWNNNRDKSKAASAKPKYACQHSEPMRAYTMFPTSTLAAELPGDDGDVAVAVKR